MTEEKTTAEQGSAPEHDSWQTDVGTTENAAPTDRQVIAFRLSGEIFGVDIGAVREIIRLQTVTHLPSAPDSVEGVINLRGGVVPVVDLSMRLNLGSTAKTDESRIIVLDIGDSDIGIFVDAVTDALRIEESSIESTTSVMESGDATYIEGIAKVEDGLLMLLDLGDALSAAAMREFKAQNVGTTAATDPSTEPSALRDESESVLAAELPPAIESVQAPEADANTDEEGLDEAGDPAGDAEQDQPAASASAA